MHDFIKDERFQNIEPFHKRVFLSSPTMHGREMEYIQEAFCTNWVTTVGTNVDQIEEMAAEYIGVKYAVALTCGTSALHLAVKLAAEKIYGSRSGISTPRGLGAGGSLFGKRVFCSDLTFDATVNPVVYEGGEPVFIDSEYETWNMDPRALERAFEIYPDVKIVILVHLYGTTARVEEIKKICEKHGALLIEDAAESLGSTYKGKQTGSFGDYGVISFNGNKIITGSSGGMLLVNDAYGANKARKWATQSREKAPWYQHEELGYNYRISNIVAGIVRGQWEYLEEHIEQKRMIYQRYKEGVADLKVALNPTGSEESSSNHWMSCLIIDEKYMCETQRSDRMASYIYAKGKSCPTEILEALESFNAEGRPVWKPMHMQSMYRNHSFVGVDGPMCGDGNANMVSADIFNRGLCLPSDNKMTDFQQKTVIDIIHRCFE